MFDHIEIKVVKFERCVAFYSDVLRPLGIELKWSDNIAAGFGLCDEENVRFLIEQSESASECHIAFRANDEHSVEEFYRSGVERHYRTNGAPGLRTEYAANYYAAYLFDPDGNNIEAVVYLQSRK